MKNLIKEFHLGLHVVYIQTTADHIYKTIHT